MLNKIIVGVDETESAYAAATRAAELALALDAELWLMSAYGKFEAEKLDLGGEEFFFTNEQSALDMLNSVGQRLRADVAGVRSTSPPRRANPPRRLCTWRNASEPTSSWWAIVVSRGRCESSAVSPATWQHAPHATCTSCTPPRTASARSPAGLGETYG